MSKRQREIDNADTSTIDTVPNHDNKDDNRDSIPESTKVGKEQTSKGKKVTFTYLGTSDLVTHKSPEGGYHKGCTYEVDAEELEWVKRFAPVK